MGPEEEEMGEGDGVEMVAEVDASVMSTSAEISDADSEVVATAVDVNGSEIGAATVAVTVSAAAMTED